LSKTLTSTIVRTLFYAYGVGLWCFCRLLFGYTSVLIDLRNLSSVLIGLLYFYYIFLYFFPLSVFYIINSVYVSVAIRWRINVVINSKVRCERAHPLYGAVNRHGLDPSKLAYKVTNYFGWMAGSNLQPLTDLSQHSSSPVLRADCYAELAVSSQAVAETIASTRCTYPQRGGQAEWAWINTGMVDLPKVVTNPSTNRARRTA